MTREEAREKIQALAEETFREFKKKPLLKQAKGFNDMANSTQFQTCGAVPQRVYISEGDIRSQFQDALVAAGLNINGVPEMDGRWHRTIVSTSSNTKALKGAYIATLDGKPNGYIKNFDTGYGGAWRPKGLTLTEEQRRHYGRNAAENRANRERDLAEMREHVAARCAKRWASLPDADIHPYLEHKGIKSFGLKIQGDKLVTPIRDAVGKIWSLQYISADPSQTKLYEKGGKKTGNFYVLGNLDTKVVLLAEGYATCASLHMATQLPVIEVFDSGNIDAVLQALGSRLKGVEKIICADDDAVTQAKVERILNNETIRGRFALTNGIGAGEIEAALKSCKQITLQANPKCILHLTYAHPQEHGGFQRVVGEIVNTETGDHLPILINNVGREKAWEAGRKHGAKVVAPAFSVADAHKTRGLTDFNDLHRSEGLNQVRAQVAAVMDITRAKGIAVEAAKVLIGEEVKVIDPHDNHRYVGPVVANVGLHAVQNVGRQVAVAHFTPKLDQIPPVGATARIEYRQGHGVVMEMPKQRGHINVRQW
jgi:putative DNA primase/helicase